MKLYELFDGSGIDVSWYVENGYITRRKHSKLPYQILNYTDKCAYERAWNVVTRKCRGLIYNSDNGDVVARPFEKFFNYGEPDAPAFDTLTLGAAYDKIDGSLGILYPTPVHLLGKPVGKHDWAIATRGSFESEQAVKGTEILYHYLEAGWVPHDGWTYLFEIVYPENRIVLDYGDTEDLFLLDIVDISTGVSQWDSEWPGPRAEPLAKDITIEDVLQLPPRPNKEGVVWVQYGPFPTRLKVKQQDYVEKHKIVFGLNARAVWEVVKQNNQLALDQFIENLPDEFQPWATTVTEELLKNFNELWDVAYGEFNDVIDALTNKESYSRKEFAFEALSRKDRLASLSGGKLAPSVLFCILDGKSIDEMLWQAIYPPHTWSPRDMGEE